MRGKGELYQGDSVRMHGQECIGEVVRVSNRYATVAFKSMEVNIPLGQLAKVRPATEAGLSSPSVQPTTRILNLDSNAFSSFNPEIDLHGMPVSRALSTIDQWIDKASLLGHKQLKIIHGKGTGILRNAIRTHLQSHGQVKRVIDKHPYPGGDGVTWLEVD
jgi:DNA mismatch repair protein MutS2